MRCRSRTFLRHANTATATAITTSKVSDTPTATACPPVMLQKFTPIGCATTSVCQSRRFWFPKIWCFSTGSRLRTLVCFHPFRQVLQYTVVETTPITVACTQPVRVTRCRRSRCHQYRMAHYMNRLISLRRISLLNAVPAVAGAVASVPAISTDLRRWGRPAVGRWAGLGCPGGRGTGGRTQCRPAPGGGVCGYVG